MELDSRKKSRRGMMRSKSFDMQKAREIGRKEAGKLKSFLIYRMGITKICLMDGRKKMQSPGEIENVKKKIYARARKML